MRKAISILFICTIFFIVTPHAYAYDFLVFSVDGQTIQWNLGTTCSAIMSELETSTGDPRSRLDVCEPTWGYVADQYPDGQYYIAANVNAHMYYSQMFSIVNGKFLYRQPSPTPTPQNHTPIPIAGTSIDAAGNMQLDGSLSSDPDNNPLSFHWKINDDTNTRDGKIVRINDLPIGTYNVSLAVDNGSHTAEDKTTVGIIAKKPLATIRMAINTIVVNKKSGTYVINGTFDKASPLLKNIVSNPISDILIEMQTGGKKSEPIYGVIGENTAHALAMPL